MPRFNRFAAASAIAAAFSMVATPAFAVELPNPGRVTVAAQDDSAAMSRRGHWGRRHHRGGVDGGDILAGVLILGGIAAVASAVENSNRNDDYRDYPPPPPPQERYDYRDGSGGSTSGLNRAADICTDAIERTIAPVGSVDSVRRGPSGWDVDGTLRDGSPFTCTIDNNGQIRGIQTDRNYGGSAYSGRSSYDDSGYTGAQYDDETYARLRESREGLGG